MAGPKDDPLGNVRGAPKIRIWMTLSCSCSDLCDGAVSRPPAPIRRITSGHRAIVQLRALSVRLSPKPRFGELRDGHIRESVASCNCEGRCGQLCTLRRLNELRAKVIPGVAAHAATTDPKVTPQEYRDPPNKARACSRSSSRISHQGRPKRARCGS